MMKGIRSRLYGKAIALSQIDQPHFTLEVKDEKDCFGRGCADAC
jgi:hypothetical protein